MNFIRDLQQHLAAKFPRFTPDTDLAPTPCPAGQEGDFTINFFRFAPLVGNPMAAAGAAAEFLAAHDEVENATAVKAFVNVTVKAETLLRESAAESLRLYRESLGWVRRQRELVALEYWTGRVTITRLRGAQNDLVDAECGCAAALAQVVKAEAQLLAAVGGRW